jgi:hypothetical protein
MKDLAAWPRLFGQTSDILGKRDLLGKAVGLVI